MNYDAMVRWEEPRLGFNSQGEEVTVLVELQASVKDVINMVRKSNGKGSDEGLLIEFVAIHGARILEDDCHKNPLGKERAYEIQKKRN